VDARDGKRVIFGLVLVGLGVLFLLENVGLLGPLGAWWPLILFAIAAGRAIEGRIGGALFFVLLGSWFLAVTHHWYGLTYENSWALVLVAVGASLVVRALTGEANRPVRASCCPPGWRTGADATDQTPGQS
jgi:hypothetical protein